MRVLLISANRLQEPYPVYPMGLDYVAGALAGDHEVSAIDLNQIEDDRNLIDQLASFAPDVVGIALRNIDNTDTTDPRGFMGEFVDLVRIVREHTDAILVLGGSGFTIFPEQILDFLEADYGVVGEGERLAPLLEALENGKSPDGLAGILTPRQSKSAPPPWELPFSRDAVTNRPYLDYYLRQGGMLNLQTKRGCPFRCAYCTYPAIEGRRMRLIPPADIARTAVSLEAAGARYLFITDSSFNADSAHSLAVGRAFQKAGLTIPWGAFFTPLAPPDGYYAELAASGLKHVEFGTDALSNPVLAAYGKPFKVHQAMAAHRQAVAAGLHVAHYLLLGGPGETPETLEETLRHIEGLEKTVVFLFCGMRIYPGTPLFVQAVAEGRIDASSDLLNPVFFAADNVTRQYILDQVASRAAGRDNWIIGAGGAETSTIISRMYQKGYSGPLWEYLIR